MLPAALKTKIRKHQVFAGNICKRSAAAPTSVESSTGCLQGEKISPGASETGYCGLNYKWLRHEYAIQSST